MSDVCVKIRLKSQVLYIPNFPNRILELCDIAPTRYCCASPSAKKGSLRQFSAQGPPWGHDLPSENCLSVKMLSAPEYSPAAIHSLCNLLLRLRTVVCC